MRGLYRDRWPIEQVPLAAKQMLGAARQFVFAPESVQRLPELTLFVGSMLSYLAATLPAAPHRLLGPQPQAHTGALAPPAGTDAFSAILPFASATSQKGLRL